MRQIAEVVLECRESSDDLPLEPVRGYPIRHALLRFGNNAVDRLPELLQGGPLGFVKFRQVVVNLLLRHELNAQITVWARPPRPYDEDGGSEHHAALGHRGCRRGCGSGSDEFEAQTQA